MSVQMKSMESEFEREKMELQKRHSDDIQEIVTDTDIRLDHMQMQYNEQANQTVCMVVELLPTVWA